MRKKLTDEQEHRLIEDYVSGSGVTTLTKKYKLSRTTFYRTLCRHRIPTYNPEPYRKIYFDKSFFTNEESVKTAYFYGFCLGDGCIQQSEKTSSYFIQVQITQSDRCVLERFCEWTGFNPVFIKEVAKNCVQIRFQDARLFKGNTYFSKWGLVPNKTYKPVIPTLPNNDDLIKSFIVGWIDADGTVAFNSDKYISLAGNNQLLTWFVQLVRDLGFTGKMISKKHNDLHGRVIIGRRDDIIEFAKLLNINSNNFYLDRKWHNIVKVVDTYKPRTKISEGKICSDVKISNHHNAGVKNGKAKLCEKDIIVIKNLLNQGYYQKDIAAMFSVNRTTICAINTGKRYGRLIANNGV